MMTSSIRRLAPSAFHVGKCWICDKESHLKWRDLAADACIGDCCIREAVEAEKAMAADQNQPIKK